MSFPIPFQRLEFIGFGEIKFRHTSGANNATAIGWKNPPDRFRLILNCSVEIWGTTTFSTNVDLTLSDEVESGEEHGVVKTTATALTKLPRRFLFDRDSLAATTFLTVPLGDSSVATGEIQAYPIPWFHDEWLRFFHSAGGSAKTVSYMILVQWLEWRLK